MGEFLNQITGVPEKAASIRVARLYFYQVPFSMIIVLADDNSCML